LNILGNSTIYGAFTNLGTVHWSNGTVTLYNLNNGAASQVWNQPGALWDVDCDQSMLVGYYPTIFKNAGELRKTASSGSTTIFVNVTNAGVITAQSGVLNFASTFYATPQSDLRIILGGATPPPAFGRIAFTSPLALAGGFSVSATNGYLPNVGDSFPVLSYPSASGDFAHLDGLDLGSGVRLNPLFGKAGLTLVAVGYQATTPPSLVVARSNHGLYLGWPDAATGWTLTTATNLTGSTWAPITVAGANNTILDAPLPEQYFRLEK
ncbi:MAG TPA: hypothetical protein VHB20_18610, partial [Verrucomicrobiae bacterium]|nr:hypothetical protein [Verrucomicrobiae bacterium]